MPPQRPLYGRTSTTDSLTYNGSTKYIQRFDGINKLVQEWDELRKDSELWSKDGDCVVHFCAPNTSRRGPSLRIPLKAVEQSQSKYLLQECLRRNDLPSPTSEDENSDSGYGGSVSSDEGEPKHCSELYVPAPPYATRHEAHLYHLGTRNYFAYLLDVPLVGESLGVALVELWKRIEQWQPTDISASDFRIYCQEQGYFSYAENADYAVASLYFCEKTRNKDMWTDAFAHCVGMYERLEHSEEMDNLSNTSKELLRKASQDMQSHIAHTTRSLGMFLEEELGPSTLGLDKALRDHMDLYRSTLHSYYVNQAGYFPPDADEPWDKRLWHGLYKDFRCLYEYLADTESSTDRSNTRGMNGGVCVAQNIQAFDERHDFTPLPHPLPLLPEEPVRRKTVEAQKGLRSFKLGRSGTIMEQRSATTVREALAKASNRDSTDVMENKLVQEYIRFERLKLEEKTTLVEARKVRFVLAYCILQMLISITRAPAEVRDTHIPSYPLCVLAVEYPHWMDDEVIWSAPATPLADSPVSEVVELDANPKAEDDDRISIHPDCEADSAADYFSNMNASFTRTDSELSLNNMIAPLSRRQSLLTRTTSIRDSVTSLHRSAVGSLARRNSKQTRRLSLVTRRDSLSVGPKKSASFHEILIAGYGNGTDGRDSECPTPISPATIAEVPEVFELPADDLGVVPTLELHQVTPVESQRKDSADAAIMALDSALSAFDFDFAKDTSLTQPSLPSRLTSQLPIKRERPMTYTAKRTGSTNLAGGSSQHTKSLSVNAGTYTPSGRHIASQIRSRNNSETDDSTPASATSSIYPEDSLQAGDIAEETTRGRGRLRSYGIAVDGSICHSPSRLIDDLMA